MIWPQNYDPLHNTVLSTLSAALPVGVLLGLIASGKARIHHAAMVGLAAALGVAIGLFHMPASSAFAAAGYGALFGLMPIGWMILNLIFLYHLTVEKGWFDDLRAGFLRMAPDPRIQLILIAFCFGAFFEGIAGFGAPVAVCSALLMQIGFRPLVACTLSLIANTAPVAFGSLGIPIITLQQATGLPLLDLSQMAGRILTPFCVVIPSWIIVAYGGWRAWRGVWPAAVVPGVVFAAVQLYVSNTWGPQLVDIVAAVCSMGAMVVLLKCWKPKDDGWTPPEPADPEKALPKVGERAKRRAWIPWIILVSLVFLWSQKPVLSALDHLFLRSFSIPALDGLVRRMPPVVKASAEPESAIYKLNLLSTVGTAILIAGVISGLVMGFRPLRLLQMWLRTWYRVRFSLLTIACMLALGYVTKYSGTDATLGLCMAHTGMMYPFFGTLLGWLGVALTGSDTASNVLFGSLQTITAGQIGVSPTLMASANSVGGVMGKMIDAQSIVVASTATHFFGHESAILRRVFWHSLALASLVGLLVLLLAYVWPFHLMVTP